MKVAHLTSVHRRDDTRIFHKECRSLSREGHDVWLVVADGLADEVRDGVHIVNSGPLSRGRTDRVLGATRRVLALALDVDADVYHLHDPELLPAGLALKRRGKRVFFDAHEDLPQQILGKPYLSPLLRKAASPLVAQAERWICGRLDGVIAATPHIRDKFLGMGVRCIDVNNYPMLGELDSSASWSEKASQICYVGSINASRGIREMVRACELLETDARLAIGGLFSEPTLQAEVEQLEGWQRVDALGMLDRQGVKALLARSLAGLVTLHPTPAYLESLPVKMFEYMAAGVPVIASDFPLWRGIIDDAGCGLCVDPTDPRSIADAIDILVANPGMAQEMGDNGKRAVVERYNWHHEELKLFDFYAGEP